MPHPSRIRRTVFALIFVTLLALAGVSAGTGYAQADGPENVFLPITFGAPSTIPGPGQ
jgi:hypothetical protein